MPALGASSADVIVIGGGIAGLSVALSLAGHARVRLLERESRLATHASGENAAIFRPLENDRTSAPLAQRSAELLAQLGRPDLLCRSGLLLVSQSEQRTRAVAEQAHAQQVAHTLLQRDEMLALEPTLDGGEAQSGLLLHAGGVLVIDALNRLLEDVARARGVLIECAREVAQLQVVRERVEGVVLRDGAQLSAAHVVLAAGAWGGELGRACGAALPLSSARRHLAVLRSERPPSTTRPVVWRLEDEVYYRPAAEGWLASPCDQSFDASDPHARAADPAALAQLADKLARVAPRLAAHCVVARSWSCLRTFAPDREIVAGPDPRLSGLHWLAALGGRGMSIAPAAGELVAQAILGAEPHPLAQALGISRLFPLP